MSQEVLKKSRELVQECIAQHSTIDLAYHNMDHIERVVKAADKLADKAQLPDEERELLLLAALYHDVGFGVDPADHEQISAGIAAECLKKLDLPSDKVNRVQELILATDMNWKGDDHLSLLLRDADMSGLADRNYLMIAEGLRRERVDITGEDINRSDWMSQNISFLKGHTWQTKEGKSLFKKGKKKNLKWLKKMNAVDQQAQTIATNKSAQTQLKTSLRNHIDLSAIADNKANIMLSVNAIVITVGVPLLIDRLVLHPQLLVPTIILGLTCLISMIFATLSTRPRKMSGITAEEDIALKKTNLFFFGNFYKMDFKPYEKGMKQVVADNELMDNSITRDLFFLGKTLGDKFSQLRVCYNVFMIGIVLAVVTYAVLLIS